MGWPRKDEVVRLYRERQKNNGYVLVIVENGRNAQGHYEALANTLPGPEPTLCATSVSDEYLLKCKRAEWSELPESWKEAFQQRFRNWDVTDPNEMLGLWKIQTIRLRASQES